jgi:RHS repeat-associated protein
LPQAQGPSRALSFTGQNQDTAANLYDFMYREYGIQGRWTSPDPLGPGAFNLADPQTLDRYAYVRSSPMSLVDPLGLAITPTYEQSPDPWGAWDEFDILNMAMGGTNYPGCPYGDCSPAQAAQIANSVMSVVDWMSQRYNQSLLHNLPLSRAVTRELAPQTQTPCTQLQREAAMVGQTLHLTARDFGLVAAGSALATLVGGIGEAPSGGLDTGITITAGALTDFASGAAFLTGAGAAALNSFAGGNLRALSNFDFGSLAGLAAKLAASSLPFVRSFAETVGYAAEQATGLALEAQGACQ